MKFGIHTVHPVRYGFPKRDHKTANTSCVLAAISVQKTQRKLADLIRRHGRLRTPGRNQRFSLNPQEIKVFQDTERRSVLTPSEIPCGPLLKKMVCALAFGHPFRRLRKMTKMSFSGVVCTSSCGQMARVHGTVDIGLSKVLCSVVRFFNSRLHQTAATAALRPRRVFAAL
jgi:hypothetical protein